MTIINSQGRQVEVTEVEVVTANEPWSEYRLADGKVLSIKNVLISVHKAVTEKNQEGELFYITKNQNIVKVK